MTALSTAGRRGHLPDAASGGGLAVDGRLLSVAELQRAVRDLRGALQTGSSGGGAAALTEPPTLKPGSEPVEPVADSGLGAPGLLPVSSGWVVVAAAHSGAGASTVALAVADAAAEAAGVPVHLVGPGDPSRCGLVGVAASELGTDLDGAWRRGRRGVVIVDRQAASEPPAEWPEPPKDAVLTVGDLGFPAAEDVEQMESAGALLVVVGRATVPGVRAVEHALSRLGRCEGAPVACAVVGPDRWSNEVTASLGPRLRGLLRSGLVVRVPLNRQLEVTGLNAEPLPRSVRAAGAELLHLLDGPPALLFTAPHRRRGPSLKARKERVA